LKILVVEDDPLTRSALQRLLNMAGHEVQFAFTAEAAMTLLLHEPKFDAVLLDILLGPHGDQTGWAVAGFMQAHAHTRDVPIVVISGMDPDDIREGAKSYANLLAKAALIIGKPVDADKLLSMLEQLEKK
jgi:CheY-like chemotaxis protein